MSKNIIEVRPIDQVIAEVRQQTEQYIESQRKRCEEKVKAIEENRRLIPLLDAEGVPLNVRHWDCCDDLTIDLGVQPTTKRKKAEFAKHLQAIRRVLGAPLKMEYKTLTDARKRLVRITLVAKDVPNVTVRYQTKLPGNAKCHIVRKKVRYTDTHLVCEV